VAAPCDCFLPGETMISPAVGSITNGAASASATGSGAGEWAGDLSKNVVGTGSLTAVGLMLKMFAKDLSSGTGRPVAFLLTAGIIGLHLSLWFHAGGLWRDEINVVNLAGRPSLEGLAQDAFPVLMPLLVKGWIAAGFGNNDFALRCLGMVIGVAIVAAAWGMAGSMKHPPLFTLALFCVNANVIYYVDSLRAYGLGCLGIVLFTGAMIALLRESSWWRTALAAGAAILSVQALFQNAALVAAICFGGWAVCWRWKDKAAGSRILLIAVIAASSLLPYWDRFFALSRAEDPLRTGIVPWIALANLGKTAGFPGSFYWMIWSVLAELVVVYGCLIFWRGWRTRPSPAVEKPGELDRAGFAMVTLLSACIIYSIMLWFAGRLTEPWYFLPLLCLAALCFDLGLWQVSRHLRGAFAIGMIVTLVASLVLAPAPLATRYSNMDEVAGEVGRGMADGDYLVVTPWVFGISFDRYGKPGTAWQTLPPMTDHSTHRYDLLADAMGRTNVLAPVIDQMKAALRSGHRVWVVSSTLDGAIAIPSANASVPGFLPPPPLPASGWGEQPYDNNWAAQVSWFLKQQSGDFRQVRPPGTGVNRYENAVLFVATGWKEPSASPGKASER